MEATKANIRREYIAELQTRFPGLYGEGSKGLANAHANADAALAGTFKISIGDAWFAALATCGVSKRATAKQIAALPD